jgi:hypothetical protein
MESQERLMEQLEESIEILEVCHKKFDKKLKLELFSDEPTVKELVEDIKQARKAVLLISENLTGEKEIMELDDAMVSKDSL